MTDKERLRNLLIAKSVKWGEFTLASGKTSNLYVDARLTTMSPEGMRCIGKLGLKQIREEGWDPDSIGGLTLGADPVAYAIAHTSAEATKALRAFTVRKEAKTHGTGKRIEGPFRKGDRVVVIEDVITTGRSALQAIEVIEAEGGIITGVLAVVDRQEGGKDSINHRGYKAVSLITREDLISSQSDSGAGSSNRESPQLDETT